MTVLRTTCFVFALTALATGGLVATWPTHAAAADLPAVGFWATATYAGGRLSLEPDGAGHYTVTDAQPARSRGPHRPSVLDLCHVTDPATCVPLPSDAAIGLGVS